MKIGKIITINDISVEIILSSNDIKIGDILEVEDNNKYVFEVVEINNISATCISLYSTRGLQKGSIVIKKNDGLEVEYSDKILGRVFDSYGDVIDGLPFESEKKAKKVAEQRQEIEKEKKNKPKTQASLADLFNRKEAGEKEINIILKADVKGSEEAVKNSLLKLDIEGMKINVIRSGIGAISESDVVLAEASNAIIIGFNIRPDHKISETAKDKGVDIRLYDIIYKVVEEMEAALKGKLEPEYEEVVLGEAEVRKLFKFSKVGTIAGSYVTSGVIKRGAKARVIRDGVVVNDSIIATLAREKDQAKEVKQGLECGITIENFNDIKEKDIIEAYELKEVRK